MLGVIVVNQLSVPPVFDYSVTPPNGNVYQLAPGQSLAFPNFVAQQGL